MSVMPPSPFLELPSSAGGGESRPATDIEGVSYSEVHANLLPSTKLIPIKGEEAPSGPRTESRIETVGVAPDPAESILPPLPGRQISNAGDELDEERFMAEIEEPPAFITAPSQGYLLACERDQTEAILEFMLR